MKVLVSTKDMPLDEWKEWRRKGIGGSDVGVIAGMNKYRSPFALYLEKLNEWPDEDQSEPAYWGHQLEDVVAKEFSERTGLEVRVREELLQHGEYDFMLANLDREVICPERGVGILECKTASEYVKSEWDGDSLPSSYYLQVQHYLAVTDYTFAYIAVLIGGNKFIYKEIERDDELIDYLIKLEHDFWHDHVESGIPPALDGMDNTSNYINNKFEATDEQLELSDEAIQNLKDLEKVKEKIKDLEEEKSALENNVKQELGECSFGTCDGEVVVTWKANKRGTRQFKPKKMESVMNG